MDIHSKKSTNIPTRVEPVSDFRNRIQFSSSKSQSQKFRPNYPPPKNENFPEEILISSDSDFDELKRKSTIMKKSNQENNKKK